ncbi:hypothetical protein EBU71_21300, partial [bacterium]|nr:hypothetical protein [Candidatus Elulimicrobium humile]
KWNDILKFIQQVRTLEFSLEMHTTIHINNWHGLLQVEEFAKEYSDSWTINFLTYPAHLDIINEVNKESLLNVLKSIKSIDVAHIINRLK